MLPGSTSSVLLFLSSELRGSNGEKEKEERVRERLGLSAGALWLDAGRTQSRLGAL